MKSFSLAAAILFLVVAASSSFSTTIFVNANSFQFALPTTNPICFEHESGADSNTVTIHYIVHASPTTGVLQLAARNPTQTLAYSEDLKVSSKEETSHFQTAMAGSWEICLKWNAEYSVRMELDIEGSVDMNYRDPSIKADDYSALTDKLLPMFEKAEYEIDYLTTRSERFEKTVSSTYSRVIWFTILEVIIMAGAVGWQIWSLRRFFKEKKVV